MVDTTIIYITDSELDPVLADLCRKYLIRAAEGKRIISVSQEPLDFGENICIGKIGRCGLNIDRQIKAGLEQVKTRYIAIAEHDCIYPPEHFNYEPPNEINFFYNDNSWLLQYRNYAHPDFNGMFSYFKNRRAQSQLIAGTDAMRRAIDQKIDILSDPSVREHWPVRVRIGEPGTDVLHRSRRFFTNPKLQRKWNAVKDYIINCNALPFKTLIPTIDIRHGDNFTGGRRGTFRRYSLSPWGTMEDILKGPND